MSELSTAVYCHPTETGRALARALEETEGRPLADRIEALERVVDELVDEARWDFDDGGFFYDDEAPDTQPDQNFQIERAPDQGKDPGHTTIAALAGIALAGAAAWLLLVLLALEVVR